MDGATLHHFHDDAGERGVQLRERLEALGQVSAELLHDLADAVLALEMRARLAAAEARAGRPTTPEMERVVEASTEIGAMIRDALDCMRGRTVSPEVTFDVCSVMERAIRRFLPGSRPVEIHLVSSLDGPVEVQGRASFLFRSVCTLLANAVRQCRREVQVGLAVEDPRRMDEQADRVVRIDVEDDGAGLDPATAATLFEPWAAWDGERPGMGLSAVAWMVGQLGGWVRHRPGETLGGACFEIRLPVAAAPAG